MQRPGPFCNGVGVLETLVMPGFMPGIHALRVKMRKDVAGRDIGERTDAVLRTAMPDHDENTF